MCGSGMLCARQLPGDEHKLIKPTVWYLLAPVHSYKAYFRWNHYCHKLKNDTSILPTETDACPSVTAAFLQVCAGLVLLVSFSSPVGSWRACSCLATQRMGTQEACTHGKTLASVFYDLHDSTLQPTVTTTVPVVQVLHTLNVAEGYRAGEQRNILQVRPAQQQLQPKSVQLQVASHATIQTDWATPSTAAWAWVGGAAACTCWHGSRQQRHASM